MSDYILINSLLQDGSEASLLKLKMIVDFKNRSVVISKIKFENLKLFCEIFKENCEICSEYNDFCTINLKDDRGLCYIKVIIEKNERL